jgi:hypothetical protein
VKCQKRFVLLLYRYDVIGFHWSRRPLLIRQLPRIFVFSLSRWQLAAGCKCERFN